MINKKLSNDKIDEKIAFHNKNIEDFKEGIAECEEEIAKNIMWRDFYQEAKDLREADDEN